MLSTRVHACRRDSNHCLLAKRPINQFPDTAKLVKTPMNCANWQKLRNKEFCLNAETPHENIGAQVREFPPADKGQKVESISADPAERYRKIKIGANKKGSATETQS